MSLTEADARRLINALQDVVTAKCDLLHDSIRQSQEILPRWIGEKRSFRDGILGSIFHRLYCYPLCVRLLTAYGMIYEGLIWIAAGNPNRGKGTLLQGLDEFGRVTLEMTSALAKANKRCMELRVIPIDEGLIDIVRIDSSKISEASSAVKKGRYSRFLSLQIEREMEKFKLDGVRDLSNIYARAKYDVEEALEQL